MSKYYKAEDVTELINACEWRMTLAKERHGEGFVDYSKQVLDVDELTKRLSTLPTIEVSDGIIAQGSGDINYQEVISTVQEIYAKGYKDGKKSVEVSEDAISRAKALEIYSDLYWMDERLLNFKDELDKVYEKLRNAQSVVPKEGIEE